MARALRARMAERKIGQKELAKRAGVNETYVRDILKGRSRNPQAAKLARVAAALDCEIHDLMPDPAAMPGELVRDPAELLLLTTWRQLTDQDREMLLDFIEHRLSRRQDGSGFPRKTI
jgi:transcriptional regulator with XRE-family HTH domain